MISALRELLQSSGPAGLALAGGLLGTAFGALTQWGNFCTMGGISDAVTMGDTRRLRTWALAAATAIIGVAVLGALGAIDVTTSMYATPRLNWAGSCLGGALFGIGMVLAGGCASRNVVRAATGDARALMVLLVTSLFAAMTLGGVLGYGRAALDRTTHIAMTAKSSTLPDMVGAGPALALILGAALVVYCLSNQRLRQDQRAIVTAVGIGSVVTLAWLVTSLAFDEMAARIQAPTALSFVKPTADAFDWLGRATAIGVPSFTVATVFGTAMGAALVAYLQGRLRFVTFVNTGDTARHLIGATLMGIGGVLALGCSVGQGISGVSTLSLGSLIAVAAMIAGAVGALRALERYA